jgi:hypothetical protein
MMTLKDAEDVLTKELAPYNPHYYGASPHGSGFVFEFRNFNMIRVLVSQDYNLEVVPYLFIDGDWRIIKTNSEYSVKHWLHWLYSH